MCACVMGVVWTQMKHSQQQGWFEMSFWNVLGRMTDITNTVGKLNPVIWEIVTWGLGNTWGLGQGNRWVEQGGEAHTHTSSVWGQQYWQGKAEHDRSTTRWAVSGVEVLGRKRQMDGWGQADDREAGKWRRSRGTPSSHRTGQMGTRKCEEPGRTHGRGQKAEAFTRNMMRQEVRDRQGRQRVINLRSTGKSCMWKRRNNLVVSEWKGGA